MLSNFPFISALGNYSEYQNAETIKFRKKNLEGLKLRIARKNREPKLRTRAYTEKLKLRKPKLRKPKLRKPKLRKPKFRKKKLRRSSRGGNLTLPSGTKGAGDNAR